MTPGTFEHARRAARIAAHEIARWTGAGSTDDAASFACEAGSE
jgi:hypothetical protein